MAFFGISEITIQLQKQFREKRITNYVNLNAIGYHNLLESNTIRRYSFVGVGMA